MKSARNTIAPAMPSTSTRWRWESGTAKNVNRTANTNRLSSESDFSIRKPARYSPASSPSASSSTSAPNPTPIAVHTIDQTTAERIDGFLAEPALRSSSRATITNTDSAIQGSMQAATSLTYGKCTRSAQLVEPDRQRAHAHAGRVEDGVGDGRGGADDADLADSLDADRVELVVVLVDPAHVDRRRVGGRRDVVAGEVVVDVVAEARVEHALLVQRHRDAHRHPADQLRACRARVDDPAGREHAGHPRDPQFARYRVNAHLGELRAVGVTRELGALLERLGRVRVHLDPRGRDRLRADPLAQLVAGREDGKAPRRGAGRAAGDRSVGQVAV